MKKEIKNDNKKTRLRHPNSHYLTILIIMILLLLVGITILYIYLSNKPEFKLFNGFSFLPDANYTKSNKLGFSGITGTSSLG